MESSRFVTGTTAIARALGVSAKTVQRMIAAGKLKEAFRTGDHTSPWKCPLAAIERIRRPAATEAAE